MIYECIGKCGQSADFETAPYPEHPTWPYLCSKCANEPARGASRNTKGIVEERPMASASAAQSITAISSGLKIRELYR